MPAVGNLSGIENQIRSGKTLSNLLGLGKKRRFWNKDLVFFKLFHARLCFDVVTSLSGTSVDIIQLLIFSPGKHIKILLCA